MKIATENLGSLRLACLGTIVLSIVACGQLADLSGTKSDSKDDGTATGTSAATNSQPFVLRGSVVSAFDIKVDSVPYKDSEDFFTQESARLPAKVKTAGYDGWTPKFDAQIGFKDLTIGMTVYTTGVNKRGYQATTVVARDGTFAMQLPPEAAGDTYKIRANKRIAVTITKENETKKFCYNFSAIDKDVPYDVKDKPIIMDEFQSSLTAYECVTDPGSNSIEIPATANDTKTTTVKTDPNLPPTAEGGSIPKASPSVEVIKNIKIPNPLNKDEDGLNTIRDLFYDPTTKTILVLKDRVKSKTDGALYFPLTLISGSLETPSVATVKIAPANNEFMMVNPTGVASYKSRYLATSASRAVPADYTNNDTIGMASKQIFSFDNTGTNIQLLGKLPDYTIAYVHYFYQSGELNVIYSGSSTNANDSQHPAVKCPLVFDAQTICPNPIRAPQTNTSKYARPKSVEAIGNNIYTLSTELQLSQLNIVLYNENLVFQKAYVVSKLLLTQEEYNTVQLATDGTNLYLVTSNSSELVFKQIKLVD